MDRALDVSSDGKWLLSGGRDSVVLIWDISSEAALASKPRSSKGKGKEKGKGEEKGKVLVEVKDPLVLETALAKLQTDSLSISIRSRAPTDEKVVNKV